ncbi:MAG TPA: S1 RNA-binding domain-containing protein [Polyangiaceae bacterium]|nr:S1 RNA-binding domain-containing protein [Polyangiaceae bacterium]
MADQPDTTTDETTHAPASAPEGNAPNHSEEPAHVEADHEAAEGEGEGEAEAEGEATESSAGDTAAEGGAPGEGGVKKKRRRRRKKKGAGEGASAEGGGGHPGGEHARPEPRKDLPLSRFFDHAPAAYGRGKSPFTAGDIVGGLVVAVERGVSVIDLFGRGIAFALENEPRALPTAPAEPEEHDHEHGQVDPSAVGNAAAEMEGHVGMPASESLPPPAPMAAGDVAVPAVHDTDDEDPVARDPHAVGVAARALRQVGTPQVDHEGNGHHEEPGTSHGDHNAPEETAAHDAASEEPRLEVGDVFRGRVASVAENGTMAISNRSVIKAESRALLQKAREEHRRVFGIVFGYNRGGFDVLVEGLRAFCPVSGLTLEHLESADAMIGQRLEFSVQAAKGGQQGVVVSRRSILEREARKRAKEIRKSLQPGMKMKGRVTQVRDFGIFVDIGGVEGLVHMSEVSWDRSVRPEQAAKVGDIVDVQIIRIGEGPPDRRPRRGEGRGEEQGEPKDARQQKREERRKSDRIALSMKAVQPDPWHTKLEGVAEGTAHKGKITRTTEFGAFVELVPGIEGLLHITEIGRDLRHANEKLKEGEEIVVVVERVDIKGHRISLSRQSKEDEKAFLEGTLEQVSSGGKAVRPGAHLKVKVERIESHGLYCQIEGVIGKRGRGFIPNAEMGTERGTDHRKKFPVGTEIDVKVVGLDRDGGWRFSRKGFAQDEERRAIQDYRREASQKGFGTFGDILAKKLKGKV